VQFCIAADEVVVVFTPEATSITDAYALIKTLHKEGYDGNIYALENMVRKVQSDLVRPGSNLQVPYCLPYKIKRTCGTGPEKYMYRR